MKKTAAKKKAAVKKKVVAKKKATAKKKAVAKKTTTKKKTVAKKKATAKKKTVAKKKTTTTEGTKTVATKKATPKKKVVVKKNATTVERTDRKVVRAEADAPIAGSSARPKTTNRESTLHAAALESITAPAIETTPPVDEESPSTPTSPTPATVVIEPRRPTESSVQYAARRLGIESLRPEQSRVIADSIAGRDVLMIVPTGFGKSACYQIPSMVLDKPVVVVSPLRALLQDQAQKLAKLDIPCVRLDGTLRGKKRKEALERIAGGGSLLVMTTPETLENPEVGEAIRRGGVSLIAIDEAHCISEWGHDFRPAYMRLGARMQTFGQPALLALTATATPRIRETIVNSLRMRNERVIASSPHRSNLAFEVLRCSGDERARALVRLALRLRRPGIVYCSTRGEVDFVYALLRRFDIPAHRYHGGMTTLERNSAHERFMGRGRTVMVATNAFGLGIDKPDIRYVLHYQTPASLEQYVQEAGRGGRDGKRANGILLYDNEDRTIHEALLQRSRVRPDQLYRLGKALAAWAEDGRTPTLEALALSAELGPRIASALLVKIEEAGIVTRQDDEIIATVPADVIEPETRNLAGQFETLRTQDGRRLDSLAEYANSGSCRAVFLRGYFGEEDDARCGLCDVCIGGRSRPANFLDPLKAPKPPRKKKPRQRQRRRQRQKQHAKHVQKQDMKQDPNQDQGEGRRRRRRRRPRRRRRARAESGPTAQ